MDKSTKGLGPIIKGLGCHGAYGRRQREGRDTDQNLRGRLKRGYLKLLLIGWDS